MRKNVCGIERVLRLVVGVALVLLALRRADGRADRERTITIGQILAMYAGGDLLVTGLMQWCPTNYLLGINTCGDEP